MARYAKLTLVCGRRGTGKTNETLTQLYAAVKGGPTLPPRKALIADFMNEFKQYEYRPGEPLHSVKVIFQKDIPRFTAQQVCELVRVNHLKDNGADMSSDDKQVALYRILKRYRNGILLVEDINTYIGDNPPNDIIGSLATLRQRGVDLIMHYQMIQKAAHPKLLAMANYIRLHFCNDEVARFADRFLDKTDIMTVAQTIVNRRYYYGMKNNILNDTGQFFSVTVDLEYHKIRGIFTEKEADMAIEEFMSKNASISIDREMKRKTRTGGKYWADYTSAYNYLQKKMKDDFFTF